MNNYISHIKAELVPIFQKYQQQLEFGYCFGSLATGSYSERSDVDIAIYLKKDAVNPDIRLSIQADCARELKRNDVDLIILNTIRNLILAERIIRDGIVLFDYAPGKRIEYELKIQHQAIDFRTQRKVIMGI